MEFTELKTLPAADPARSKRVWSVLWGFAVFCIIVGYYLVPVPLPDLTETTRRLATISAMDGAVFVQSATASGWYRANQGQVLGNGDRVSTGLNGSARIDFDDGRMLALASESTIEPSGIVRADGKISFDIKLLRGAIKAVVSTKCTACSPISIRSGGETFALEKGKVLGLYKPAGGDPIKFDPRGPWPRSITPESIQANLANNVVASIKRRSSVQGVAALSNASDRRSWWTLKPLVQLSRETLEFQVGPPQKTLAQWQPMLYLGGPGGRGGRRTLEISDEGVTALPIRSVSNSARRERGPGFRAYKFSLRPGGRYLEGRRRQSVVDDRVQDFEVRTFGENLATPLTVGLDRVVPVEHAGPFFWPKDDLPIKDAAVSVKLASARDIEALEPIIRGATAMTTQAPVRLSNGGTFALKSEKIVAELSGRSLSRTNIEVLAQALSANIVYEGERDALIPIGNGNANFLAYRVNQLRRRSEVSLLRPNGDLVQLSVEEYPTAVDLAAAINEGVVGLFRSPVKIKYLAKK